MKRMMIAVAVVAMALGLGVTVQRRKERCLRLSDFHQAQAEAWSAEAYERVPHDAMGIPDPPSEGEASEREVVQRLTQVSGAQAGQALKWAFAHRALSEAYRRAANRPWIDFALRSFEP
jgi:hypothetical protein